MNHRVTLRHFHVVPDRTQKRVELLHRILALISEGTLKIDPPLYTFLSRPILFASGLTFTPHSAA